MSIKFETSRFTSKILLHLPPNAPKTLFTPQKMCFTCPENIIFALSA